MYILIYIACETVQDDDDDRDVTKKIVLKHSLQLPATANYKGEPVIAMLLNEPTIYTLTTSYTANSAGPIPLIPVPRTFPMRSHQWCCMAPNVAGLKHEIRLIWILPLTMMHQFVGGSA